MSIHIAESVQLTAEEGKNFDAANAQRRAVGEAAEIIARSFSQKIEVANAAINSCYKQAASKYGLDLEKCGYEYNQKTKTLVLRAVRYDG